jgi:hypothetical protein
MDELRVSLHTLNALQSLFGIDDGDKISSCRCHAARFSPGRIGLHLALCIAVFLAHDLIDLKVG